MIVYWELGSEMKGGKGKLKTCCRLWQGFEFIVDEKGGFWECNNEAFNCNRRKYSRSWMHLFLLQFKMETEGTGEVV